MFIPMVQMRTTEFRAKRDLRNGNIEQIQFDIYPKVTWCISQYVPNSETTQIMSVFPLFRSSQSRRKKDSHRTEGFPGMTALTSRGTKAVMINFSRSQFQLPREGGFCSGGNAKLHDTQQKGRWEGQRERYSGNRKPCEQGRQLHSHRSMTHVCS